MNFYERFWRCCGQLVTWLREKVGTLEHTLDELERRLYELERRNRVVVPFPPVKQDFSGPVTFSGLKVVKDPEVPPGFMYGFDPAFAHHEPISWTSKNDIPHIIDRGGPGYGTTYVEPEKLPWGEARMHHYVTGPGGRVEEYRHHDWTMTTGSNPPHPNGPIRSLIHRNPFPPLRPFPFLPA